MLKVGQNWAEISNYPPNAQHKSVPLATSKIQVSKGTKKRSRKIASPLLLRDFLKKKSDFLQYLQEILPVSEPIEGIILLS